MASQRKNIVMQGRQRGIGLVEIMISLVLGLLVTGAIVQIYLTTKRQNDMQTSLTGRQESGRYAAHIIQQDAQMVGFRGCIRDRGTVVNTLKTPTNFLYDFGQHVVGFNNADAVNVPAVIANVEPDTDVLTLRTVDDTGLTLTANMLTRDANPVTVPGLVPSPLAGGDFVLLADCSGAAIFQVDTYNSATGAIEHVGGGTPGNNTLNLGRIFRAGAQIFRLRTTTYFISPSDNLTGPALWRQVGDAPAQEIAEGIENMQVFYGEDLDANQTPDAYRTADAVADWSQVVSVQVALLAAGTQDRVADADPRTFTLLDEVVDPNADILVPPDGRLRRVITFTVAMRNRVS